MSASIEARIAEHAAAPIPPTSPAYDQAPLGHRAAMIRMRDDILEEDMPPQRRFILTAPLPRGDAAESSAAARPPRGQYDFVDTIEAGQSLVRSPGHNSRTIARAADRAEDVGHVRELQASEHRMMTFIEEVNLRISYQAQVRRQESEYFYTHLHDAQTARKILDSRLMCKRPEDCLRDRVAKGTPGLPYRIMLVTRQGTNIVMALELIQAMIDQELQRNSTHAQDDGSQSSGRGLRRPVQPARICSYADFIKCQPLNFKGTEGIVGLSQWIKKIESVFHISGCAVDNQVKFATCTPLGAVLTWWNGHLANDLMDQKLRTYVERQNDNKRKADDSSRNNQQQQTYKKQNVARAYTAGPGEKKTYTRNLPLCTKCNYHYTEKCAPKCGNCK
nr:reverse transcriptase domain-containing protein [Tanacetum cinerariifolium]